MYRSIAPGSYLAPSQRRLPRDVLVADMLRVARMANRHYGITIISGPIIGGKYFTHNGLVFAFLRHGMCQIGTHNLSIDQATPFRLLPGQAIRRSGAVFLLDVLPESLVRQRAYVVRGS
jgi:hypothetical protein